MTNDQMTNDQMTSNPIEEYLSGQLSPEEAEAFEAKLDKDPALRLQVEELLRAKTAIWQEGREEERAYLIEMDEQLKTQQRSKQMRFVLLGAVAIVIFLLTLTFLFISPSASPESLFAAYYERPAAPEMLSPGADSLFLMAHSAFNQNRIAEARALYETALLYSKGQGDISSEAALYLGICYLEENQPTQALDAFDKAAAFPEQAQWYRTLAYLRTGDRESAHALAEEIASTEDHFFQEKAIELLKAW